VCKVGSNGGAILARKPEVKLRQKINFEGHQGTRLLATSALASSVFTAGQLSYRSDESFLTLTYRDIFSFYIFISDHRSNCFYYSVLLLSFPSIIYSKTAISLPSSSKMTIPTEWYKDNFLISTKTSLLQPKAVNEAFGTDAVYWARPIDEALLEKMLNNSLCFGVYKLPSSTSNLAGQ
jgi:hypothetical protein